MHGWAMKIEQALERLDAPVETAEEDLLQRED
jgi:hypothetical protein